MSKRFQLEIRMDNAAFEEDEGWEVARILRGIAEDIGMDGHIIGRKTSLFDINGNKVGTWEGEEL